ncbi:hypothetical protein ASD38_17385 [Caulobacter sp. Root487D2Y]|nr:hypothetical protein ASD38_17385 [Caulobacter sp. Root487D2Y]
MAAGVFIPTASAALALAATSATPLRLAARAPLTRRLARPAPATSALSSALELWAASLSIRFTLATCTSTRTISLHHIRSSGVISLLPAMAQRYGSSERR